MAREKFDNIFSLWCNLGLKFGKIASELNLTEQWEAYNYHIIFWLMTSKAEFRSESAVQFLYIFSIYVIHLATKFYKKMKTVYKNRAGLSLLNYSFDVTDQKTIWQLLASLRSVKVKAEMSFQSF